MGDVIDGLSDAWGATRDLLTPLDWRQWGALTIVALFAGGGMGIPSGNFSSPGGTGGDPGGTPSIEPALDWATQNFGLVVAAVAGGLAVMIALGILKAVLELALVASLRAETVQLRANAAAHWERGIWLFVFRFVLGVVTLASVVGLLALMFGPLVFDLPVWLLVLLPVAFLVALAVALVGALTTTLVIPIMVDRECGVLAAWRALLGALKEKPAGYAGYVVVGGLTSGVLNMAVSIVVLIATVVIGIVFLLLGAIVWFAAGASLSPVVLVVGGLLAVVLSLLVLAIGAAVRVPVMVFVRYYGMFVLGALSPALDPIPNLRARMADG
jgi:hypothetical protein